MQVARIADLLAAEQNEQGLYYSFEFLSPRTETAENAFWNTVPQFITQKPVFVDVTWGAAGHRSERTLRISRMLQERYAVTVNMHLTCTNMPIEVLRKTLDACRSAGIRNILALRGDPPEGMEWTEVNGGLNCALDLVKFIRSEYGNFFCITVAGYPEGHPSAIDPTIGKIGEEGMLKELDYLKAKVDAGASLIITQLFYVADIFIDFVKKCRAHNIMVPILPGILPISSEQSLVRIVNLCKTYVPPSVLAKVRELRDDAEALRSYGISHAVEMVRLIREANIGIGHFHIYVVKSPKSVMGLLEASGDKIIGAIPK